MATATPAAAAIDAYACAQCGAPTTFDPGTTRLVCDHCNNAVEIVLATEAITTYDLFGKTAIASLHATDLAKGAREIVCKQCGAHAIVTRRAERCAFCDAPMVVEMDRTDPSIPPGAVIPFVVPSKDAAARFGKWLAGRWFAPGDLVARSRRDHMDGVYLPFWTFDAQSTTQYDGARGTVHTSTETYKDANGQDQTRTVETVDWMPVSGTVHVTSKDVLIGASPTLPVKLVHKLEPWELPRQRSFDPRFLAGFAAERYQIQPADGFTAAYPTIEGQIRGAINRDIGGDRQRIDGMNVSWDAVGFRHLLLPVWLSAFRYNDKVFHVAVNAATGEVVGERPYSVGKIVALIVAIVAMIAVAIGIVVSQRHAASHAKAAECDTRWRPAIREVYAARSDTCTRDEDCLCASAREAGSDLPCDVAMNNHSNLELAGAKSGFEMAGCTTRDACPPHDCTARCADGHCAIER
jgi:hypothetical protein